MGHTLVTAFSKDGYQKIEAMFEKAGAKSLCKIPYGRDCQREEAERILKHHITMFHWAKKDDEKYLSLLNAYRFERPCTAMVSAVSLKRAEKNSLMLYLNVKPSEGFEEMRKSLEQTLGAKTSPFLHITLAISKDHEEIQRLYERISAMEIFPFTLEITGMDLYHIWKPVKLIRQYR